MKVEDAIKIRRSIRKYKDIAVPEDLINELIEAARLAPSAYNAQPWKFFIVKDKNLKQKLKDNNIFKHPFVYEAPLIIICCGDPDVFPKERFENIYSNASEIGGGVGAVRDVSIASQNLVLRATELGLGTCYIGLVNREKIKEILNIPKNYVLPFAILAGYPDEAPKPTPRKKIDEMLFNY
ncbi:MAG: nitroreductase family protein [Candidatus Staskawiczbacteria bacterium]|jgi:nitroreductase